MNSYTVQLVFLLLGCIVLAFGVYLELLGDVGMLSGDAFIKAIAIVTEKDYGNVKIVTDVSMSVISAVIALITLRKLVGVREGTVIAALIVGIIIKFFQKKFKPVADKILPSEKPVETADVERTDGFVITVSREYGSGGRNIGKLIADMADRVKRVSKRDGLSEEAAVKKIQKVDKERSNYSKEFYGMDWGKCGNYDMAFNTSRIGAESIVSAVLKLEQL